MRKMSKKYLEDLEWARNNHTELLKKYPDQWVAIVNKKVVSFGNDLSKVREEARSKTNLTEIPVMFVECGEHIYAF